MATPSLQKGSKLEKGSKPAKGLAHLVLPPVPDAGPCWGLQVVDGQAIQPEVLLHP